MSYRILRQLARGGFSEIFEVEDPASALPERLILKRLTGEMSARPDVRAAFSEEAKILRELKHPNVVTFRRCYFDERQRICLLMEKVTGEPLDAWARRRASQPDVVLDLFVRVLEAVDYLHHRPLPFLHLDLKPDNVLVTTGAQDAEPVLIDFGIARRSGGKGLKAYTPPYGAPEQATGGALGCWTDIYALGQILRELLEIAGGGATAGALAAVAAVAEKATRPAWRQRYADAGEMKIVFRRARLMQRAMVPHRDRFPTMRLPQLPKWALPVAGAVLCTGVISLFAFGGGGAVPPNASAPEESAALAPQDPGKDRFTELQYRFEKALIAGDQDAVTYYHQACDLSDKLPQGSETWRWMKRELDMMSIDLSRAEAGGPESEEVRTALRQKHLSYSPETPP